MTKTQEVRLIAVVNRHKKHPYTLPIPEAKIGNTFVTGQHIDPLNDKTKDNLTREQMLGTEKLTDEQKKRFPYVVNPMRPIKISNVQTLNIAIPEQKAIYDLVLLSGKVALSKFDYEVDKKRYYFYIDDPERNSVLVISRDEKIYKAKGIIYNATEDGLIDLALLANYHMSGFTLDVESSSLGVIKASLLTQCESNVDAIEKVFSSALEDDLFLLNLVRFKILTRKGSDFYDGTNFVGNSLDRVKEYMKQKENAQLKDKWWKLLLEKRGKLSTFNSPKESKTNVAAALKDLKIALFDEKKEQAQMFYDVLVREKGLTPEEVLRYKDAIDELGDPEKKRGRKPKEELPKQ